MGKQTLYQPGGAVRIGGVEAGILGVFDAEGRLSRGRPPES
jgi:hypothetical protein